MNQIAPKSINFNELVKSSNTTLSLNVQNQLVERLNTNFTEDEQRWYVANLYMYMNYHPTNDYPINLENVFHMIGFANKGNAMKTIKNNFTKDEDYKTSLLPKEKSSWGGSGSEQIMLNIDTFKNLCMLAKTDKGKQIRKYYVKLENVYNELVKQEIDQKQIEIQQQKELLEKEKETVGKLLEEKDRYIAQLKQQEAVSHLYIAHNPVIKNLHKIGIFTSTKTNDVFVRQENHKSSNPHFEYLFTYETKNAKMIEDLVKLLLKHFKVSKPEWFTIPYDRMKQVVDFAIMAYENYHIEENVDNLIEFISRYRSNRLVNTNKARVCISKDIYETWFKENVVIIPGAKISTELVCKDFYEWYQQKYPEDFEKSHIKLDTGNWSTTFQKEITSTISEISNLEYKQGISLSDRKRSIYFPKCAGFVGFEVKSMNSKIEFFDNVIYEKYVNEFITVTNDPRNKVARKEILDHFLGWVKDNNYVSKNRIMCRNSISSIFRDTLIESIQKITGLQIKDVCKLTYYGCFVGMIHKEFPFTGNESSEKVILLNSEIIKKQIDIWIKNTGTNISKVFRKTLDQNNTISKEQVKIIMNSKYNIDLTCNTKKNKWYLVFDKKTLSDNTQIFYIKDEALEYVNANYKLNY
jgi:phage anti-repressor protein